MLRRDGPTITIQQSGTLDRLQAISPVTPRIVWASGLGGTFAVTTDGRDSWAAYDLSIVQGTPTSGALSVDFRDSFNGIGGGGELVAPDAIQGDNWYSIPGLTGFWAVAFANPKASWLAGTQGRIVFLRIQIDARQRSTIGRAG